MKKEILRMEDICRTESSIEAVQNANFHVFSHEIVGLVGKNHAGKSTLMGAVTGEYPCTSGKIWIGEKEKKIFSIEQARKEGVFLIKDESSLISGFTIEDTMKLNFAFAGKEVKYSQYVKKYKNTLRLLEVSEDNATCIRNLNFHKRVLIEIAQALVCDAKLLVLDNVVSILSNTARQEMHALFRLLTHQGISLVLIESQEDVIQDFLDRLYIMRRGCVVAELSKKEMEHELIMSLIEGAAFVPRESSLHIQSRDEAHHKIMEFEQVCTDDGVTQHLTFFAYRGETLGIWNKNRHSGKAITDVLEGKTRMKSGRISVNGELYKNTLPNRVGKYELATVPEKDEMFSNMNLGENISLAALRKNAYLGVVKKEWELRYIVQKLCSQYFSDRGCRLFPNQRIPEGILAKKKVSLCRAIASGAKIIVYNNPCLKMDVREREVFIQDILRTQKEEITQVIISSQLDTLYSVCNRILQLDEGRIVKEIENNYI
ncbi:MAG TPA: ATP-binding cassette domain-containing protein [Candidatus Blautia faecipullorum]|nr:ATP-binding cassette domain-containing protein [Candidatus Blautia faecipullorum]